MQNKTKKLALMGVATAVAMILSYIEFLLPPLFSAIPGIKLGLANIIVIFLLYRLDFLSAATVSLVRACLSALLFGSVMTLAYSLSGAVLSVLLMYVFKKWNVFSGVGVSVIGGVSHNLGQILMAIVLLGTKEIGYYMIPLTVSGIVAGVFVGIAATLLLKYIRKI